MAITDDIAIQIKAGQDWIPRQTSPVLQRLSPAGGYSHDRIRVSNISSDFCSHAMSYLIAELSERHDRDRFEVFGYCSSPEDGSKIRARVIKSFDHYKRIRGIPDDQAARLIRDEEIDILARLNGLKSGVRPQILRWKPAPVQTTYLGFVGPVPLPELDYRFCDQIVVPPRLASAYRQIPFCVSGNFQSNDSKSISGIVMYHTEVRLSDENLVCCGFSSHYKITETICTAWMEILHATDNTILWLARDNHWSEINLRQVAKRAGIACERVFFADRIDPVRSMSLLRLADLLLDAFPFNAGTIAGDQLRMELPMLTPCSEAFASQMATSLFTALGMPDAIATSRTEYVAKAVMLATDAPPTGFSATGSRALPSRGPAAESRVS